MEIQSDKNHFSVNEVHNTEILNQALDLYESQGAKVGAAMAALKLGNIMMDQEEYGRVLELLQKAFDYFDRVQSDEGLARAHLLEGRLSLKMKRHNLSLESLNKGITLTSQPDLEWKLWYHKGQAFEQKQVPDSARSAYRKSIAIIEQLRGNLNVEELKSAFVSNKVVVYGKYIDLLLRSHINSNEQNLLEEAFEVNERARARAFLDMIGNNKVGALESQDMEAIELEQLLRAKIQQLNKKIHSTKQRALIKDLSEELRQAQQQYQQLLLEIKLDHPGYSELIAIDPPPLSKIRQKLDTGSLIIEYWSGEEGTIVWLISNASVKGFRLKIPKITVKRLISLFRNSVELQDRSFIQKSLGNLYDILILPFEKDLVNYDRLIFIPHGGMHFLPFQALVDKSGHYLVEKYVIYSAPSASVWLHCLDQGETEGKNELLGMALGRNPVGNYPGLPATTREIDQLAKIYDSFEGQSGTGFTESYFKNSVKDFDYLHVATHGVLNRQQPGYSYLLMHPSDHDDGKLTVNEIFNVKLNARLVTLSACETGLGAITEGDDLVGLSRAFIYGGSPAVVVSLWKVDDASTAVLMTRFHQYLASGKDVASALSFAQRDFIQRSIWSSNKGLRPIEWDRELQSQVEQKGNEVYQNPYYWAPFVLIGY